jgi:hypothetical protein
MRGSRPPLQSANVRTRQALVQGRLALRLHPPDEDPLGRARLLLAAGAILGALVVGAPLPAGAQDPNPGPSAADPQAADESPAPPADEGPKLELGASVDAYFSWNDNRPADHASFFPGAGTSAKRANEASINLAQLDVGLAPKPVGLRLSVGFGTADRGRPRRRAGRDHGRLRALEERAPGLRPVADGPRAGPAPRGRHLPEPHRVRGAQVARAAETSIAFTPPAAGPRLDAVLTLAARLLTPS